MQNPGHFHDKTTPATPECATCRQLLTVLSHPALLGLRDSLIAIEVGGVEVAPGAIALVEREIAIRQQTA